jgi:hypothetical protein
MVRDWETLQKEHTIRTQALTSQRSLKMAPDLPPPPSTQLHCAQALAHVGEYAQIVRALTPNTPKATSIKTIMAFCHLHPLVEVDLPPFVDNFHLKTDLVLDRKACIYALTHSPCFSSNDPSSMVYELL